MIDQEQQFNATVASARKLLFQARTDLLMASPFYGRLAMRLQMKPVKDFKFLAAVDGVSMFYNPERILQARHEITGLLEHEILHLILEHHTRRDGRDARQWNQACDYAVNSILKKDGSVLPKGALHSALFDGMTAEEVYGRLGQTEDKQEQGGQGQGKGQGKGKGQPGGSGQPGGNQPGGNPPQPQDQGGGNQPGGNPGQSQGQGGDQPGQGEEFGGVLDSSDEVEARPEEWQVAATQALRSVEGQGSSPAGVKAVLEEKLRPKVPWKEQLRNLMTAMAKDDYSWARPNKRFISSGLYMPEAKSESAASVVIAVDTSGSVDVELLKTFMEGVKDIFQEVQFEELILLFVGIKVRQSYTFYQGETLELKDYTRGGGTRFQPAFDTVAERGVLPDFFIYFTDMYCKRFPPEDPGYPVIWACPEGTTTNPGMHVWEHTFGDAIELSE